jgi:hypothetical protein
VLTPDVEYAVMLVGGDTRPDAGGDIMLVGGDIALLCGDIILTPGLAPMPRYGD